MAGNDIKQQHTLEQQFIREQLERQYASQVHIPQEQSFNARDLENNKTARQRAEDIAYTINHALLCAATDIIDPFIAAWSQKYLGQTLHTSFCNLTHDHSHHGHNHASHDHEREPTAHHEHEHHHPEASASASATTHNPLDGHDHSQCTHEHINPLGGSLSDLINNGGGTMFVGKPDPSEDTPPTPVATPATPATPATTVSTDGHQHEKQAQAHEHHHHHELEETSFGGALKHWIIGEAIGDLGAIPVTIAFQHFTPGFMDWLSKGIETLLGPVYRHNTMKAAEEWAGKQGFSAESSMTQAYADELYQYETRHFGQAAVWAVSSVGLNVASQKLITGNSHPVGYMLLYKTLGAGLSTSILLGGRALVPEKFHEWDKFTTDHIFNPVTQTIGNLFGVKDMDISNTIPSEHTTHGDSWLNRIRQQEKEGQVVVTSSAR